MIRIKRLYSARPGATVAHGCVSLGVRQVQWVLPGRRGHFALVFTRVKCPRLPGRDGRLRRMPGMPGYPGGIGRRHGPCLCWSGSPSPPQSPVFSVFPVFGAFRHCGRGHRGHPAVVKTTPKCPRCSGKTVRDPPHSTRNAPMAHRCCCRPTACHNDGPPMLLSADGLPQRWPTDAAETASVGHRCR